MRFGEAFSDGMSGNAYMRQPFSPSTEPGMDSMPGARFQEQQSPAFQNMHTQTPYAQPESLGPPPPPPSAFSQDATATSVYASGMTMTGHGGSGGGSASVPMRDDGNPMLHMSSGHGTSDLMQQQPAMSAMPSDGVAAARDTSLDDSAMALRQGQPWSHTSPTKRMDPSEIDTLSRVYYVELLQFFRNQEMRTSLLTPSRSNAREKLTRLNKQQFAELSTDVHDELQRRQDESQSLPFLQGRDDFHPKRNQARQKLATLPKNRFRDLASDVFFELERRYPNLPQELRTESLEELMGPREGQPQGQASSQAYVQPPNQPYSQPPSQSYSQPSNQAYSQPPNQPYEQPPNQPYSQPPSQAYSQQSPSQAYSQQPNQAYAQPPSQLGRDAFGQDKNFNPEPAQSDMVQDSASTQAPALGQLPGAQRISQGQPVPVRVSVPDSASREPRPRSTRMSSIVAQQQLANIMADAQQMSSTHAAEEPAAREAPSAAAGAGAGAVAGAGAGAGASARSQSPERGRLVDPAEIQAYQEQVSLLQKQVQMLEEQEHALRTQGAEHEKMVEQLRTDNSMLKVRVDALQQDLAEREHAAEEVRNERDKHRVALDDKDAELLQHRANLDALRAQYNDLNLALAAKSTDAETEAQWRRQLEEMQRETGEQQRMVQELRGEVATLLDELRRLSARNDAMTADKESDVAIIRDLHQQMSSYKRRYEGTKAELRMAQSTSQLWSQPHVEEWKYVSPNGAVADTNLRSFQSAIDELLTSARSNTPSNVLVAMKTVVLSTTLVTDDVAKYEAQPDNDLGVLSPQQRGDVETLKSSLSDALTNLMNACRNHASSQGLAPVSLIDAAATHVAIAVVELVKLLKLRRVPRPSEDDFSFDSSHSPTALGSPPNGLKPLHMRGTVSPSASMSNSAVLPSRMPAANRRPSATTSSPTPVRTLSYSNSNLNARMRAVDLGTPAHQPPTPTMPSATEHPLPQPPVPATTTAFNTAPEPVPACDDDELENWSELRNYIEVQTEAIVHSIQSLLSALREGAQGVQLNENLTQITTIVSSIVAISRDHLPQAATSRHGSVAMEAERIFAELTENCDRLSDMQSNTTFDRSAKSVMASASYGVAKGLKALNELLNAVDDA